MSSKFTYLADQDMLRFKSSGRYRLGTDIHRLQAIAEKLSEYQCQRFLPDHRGNQVIAQL